MRAGLIYEHGGPEVVRVAEVPDPQPGPREVVIRQHATSVNHRDIWLRTGLADATFQVPLPLVLGIDTSGEVVAVGAEVERVRVGDRVVVNPYIACGRCHSCRRQRPDYCADLDIANGSYAELVCVPEARTLLLDPSVPADQAACFPNTYITAWEMLINKAHLTPGDTVFIWAGTGGLGSAAIDIAKLVGARIIATAGQATKLDVLARLGPDLILNHHADDVVAQVMQFTDGEGASVVFEHVGEKTWERSIDLAAAGARIISAGLTSGQTLCMNVVTMIMKQFTIRGSMLGTMDAARAVTDQLNRGRLTPLIGRTMPLTEIAEAHRALQGGQVAGKLLIDIDH